MRNGLLWTSVSKWFAMDVGCVMINVNNRPFIAQVYFLQSLSQALSLQGQGLQNARNIKKLLYLTFRIIVSSFTL